MKKHLLHLYQLKYVFFFLILSQSITGCKTAKDSVQKPNVLIILTDDLGYGDISSYNAEAVPTPHINRIGEEGVLCTDFYVPTPYCAPSRATLLTGRFPLRNGLFRNPTPDQGIDDVGISQDEILLGEVFQEAGYRTSLIGKWHLGHKEEFFPVKHGFDEYFGILYSNDMRPVQHIENMDTVEYPIDQRFLTKRYTERAVEFIHEQGDNPFFLHLCHPMPHKPLAASDEFYTPETEDNLYDDVIRELDWSTGQLLDALEKKGILDRTIVIFMSDNGASYGGSNMPLKGRKHDTWEGGTRVPFLIRYPDILPRGKTIETPCWSADIFPTLLSMTGIAIPENLVLDGENIEALLKGEKTDHKAIFTMRGDEIETVRKGDWKLFIKKPRFHQPVDLETWSDWRGPDGETILAPFEQATPAEYPGVIPEHMEGEVFLFNLREDISEMNNVADDRPDIVQTLEKEYQNFVASLDNVDAGEQSSFAQSKKENSKPNVVMIIFDDLRDHESFTPFKVQTPNFDRLAERGMKFDRAYCQLPVCNSSRASFLSGLRPPTTRVVQNTNVDYKLSKDVVTLPQALRNNGYYTISIGKVFHSNTGDGRSWDKDMEHDPGYRDPIQYHNNKEKYADDPNLIFLNEKSFEYLYKGPEDLASYGYTDHLIAEDVEEFLDQAAKSAQPFFLAAGFKKPHNPYIGPSSYFDLYPPETLPLISEPEDLTGPYDWATPPSHRDAFDAMDTYHRKLFMSAYCAVTTFSDNQMGRLLDKMDEHNLWDNTIVICFGDHGYHLGEHNNHWGKVTLYELSARVPMIFYVPGMKTGGHRTKGVVELVDLFPTLADLLGITPPENLEGESFKPLLDDPSRPWDNEAFIYEGNDVDNLHYSIVTDRYRYTVWADHNPVRYELYDHSKDPGEYYNLIKDMSLEEIKHTKYADVVSEMEDRRANPSNPNNL